MQRKFRGFTLIELLAVVLVIAIMCAVIMMAAGYIQGRANAQRIRGQLIAIATALEAYKSDFGYYPRTNRERLSADGTAESENNELLYRALLTNGRRYFTSPPRMVRVNSSTNRTNLFVIWHYQYSRERRVHGGRAEESADFRPVLVRAGSTNLRRALYHRQSPDPG
jgi:prepilin-type N-terminal cleavage/methylation domain-containing protein